MSKITACGNALVGTLTCTKAGAFTFGRTVIVTGAFVRRISANSAVLNLHLNYHSSAHIGNATQSEIGTLTISVTLTGMDFCTWRAMAVTAKTFTSSEVLGLAPALGATGSMGVYDLIVRYKEK